jgi:hypothetical protein
LEELILKVGLLKRKKVGCIEGRFVVVVKALL